VLWRDRCEWTKNVIFIFISPFADIHYVNKSIEIKKYVLEPDRRTDGQTDDIRWWFSIVVTSLDRSTKLLYARPGLYLDG